jgi:hypothetical protein
MSAYSAVLRYGQRPNDNGLDQDTFTVILDQYRSSYPLTRFIFCHSSLILYHRRRLDLIISSTHHTSNHPSPIHTPSYR